MSLDGWMVDRVEWSDSGVMVSELKSVRDAPVLELEAMLYLKALMQTRVVVLISVVDVMRVKVEESSLKGVVMACALTSLG